MDIKPIKTEADYEEALKAIECLMDAQPDTLEGDRLDILTTLVEAYEAKHHPIDTPDPIEAIKHRMEALGLEQKDLERIMSVRRERVWEILNRRRPLSISMIRRLHSRMNIPAEILIKPY